ncbi:MAG: Zn-ribbon domain-containing protein [Halobacteriaceae archaeon]
MPHQCTTCGNVFDDGSKEMLGGCPECGNNTFQFHAGEAPDEPTGEPPEPEEPPGSRVGRAADTVREFVASEPEWPDWPGERGDSDGMSDDADIIEAPDASTGEQSVENRAQADARTEVVDAGDIAVGSDDTADASGGASDGSVGAGVEAPPEAEDGRVVSEPAEEETDLAALREELDEQFESIRIVEPGQYELNLMELYDRQEYIIALQEDGRYVIEVPDSWREDALDEGN